MIQTLLSVLVTTVAFTWAETFNDTLRAGGDMTIMVKVLPGAPVTFSTDPKFGVKARKIDYVLQTLPRHLISVSCMIKLPCVDGAGVEIYGKEGHLEFTECSNGFRPQMTDVYQEFDSMTVSPFAFDAEDPSYKCSAEIVAKPRPVPVTTPIPVKPIQPVSGCECGKTFSPRVVNGQLAQPGQIPWQVSYQQIMAPGSSSSICGATMLNDIWVLTAAHCIIDIRETLILFGTVDVTQGGTMVRPKKIIGHPYYQEGPKFNDIALIMVEKSIKYSPFNYPACLPRYMRQETFAGANLQISGWGLTREKGKPSTVLLKAVVKGISNDDCKKSYGARTIGQGMLCATNPGIDTCQGDSGGPLTVHANNGRHYVVGVVSWGKGCARPNYPGIYARVTNYIDWIDHVTQGDICSV